MANCKRVVLNGAAVTALLNGPEVKADLQRRCDAVARSANAMVSADGMRVPAFVSNVAGGYKRAIGFVSTGNRHGVRHNNKHNTLVKALGAGG